MNPVPQGYIVGPMRRIRGCNFQAFDIAAARGRALGLGIVSPAEMDREAGISPPEDDPCDGETMTQHTLDDIVRRDMAAILALRAEHGDFVAVLPGFEKSTGGKAEIALAQFKRLAVLDARTFKPLDIRVVAYTPYAYEPHPQEIGCADGVCGLVIPDGTLAVARAMADGKL